MATPEFLITNLVDSATAISAYSELASLPVENVQSKSRTKVWRSDGLANPEWIKIDLGSAVKCKRAVIINHNISDGGTTTLKRHTSDDLGAATTVGTFGWDADFMVLDFDATYRWWWFHVSDAGNSDGYIEIGRIFLGDFSTTVGKPSIGGFALAPVDPSVPTSTPEGIVGRNTRSKFNRLSWQFKHVSEADRDTLITIYDTIGAYNHFFLRLDPSETVHSQGDIGGMYGYFTSQEPVMSYYAGQPSHWSVGFTFEEAR
jgi:hypothetical protein